MFEINLWGEALNCDCGGEPSIIEKYLYILHNSP